MSNSVNDNALPNLDGITFVTRLKKTEPKNTSVVNRPADVSAAIPVVPDRWGIKSHRFPKSV